MNQSIRSPFPWLGGKAAPKIHKALLELLPPHTRYVEPFGGGASILLAKAPCEVEVYNDVNRGVVNFFRVVADADLFGRFVARVAMLPTSRELYEEYLRTWVGIHDPLEQAIRWYYVARQSFGGIFGSSWGTGVTTTTTQRWKRAFDNLPAVHERMQRVQIECADWRDVLRRLSGPGYLAYCDPPYVLGARKAGGYEHELRDEDHQALIETLLQYDGAVMLSGYYHKIYAPLEHAGWQIHRIDVVCSAAGRTRGTGLLGEGAARAKQARTECIWLNPEAVRRRAALSHQ